MIDAKEAWRIFAETTEAYHATDNIDAPMPRRYPEGSINDALARKNWIDAVQWHLEDIIRVESIDPRDALAVKRRIDRSNQDRTDLVEQIDDYFLREFATVEPRPDAAINTESPAWAIDRLSILALKIWHMREQLARTDAPQAHLDRCRARLDVLLEQQADLMQSIDTLLADIAAGDRRMKVYRQMKMYNDPAYTKKA